MSSIVIADLQNTERELFTLDISDVSCIFGGETTITKPDGTTITTDGNVTVTKGGTIIIED